jgi:hypothetical protein
MHLLLQKLLKTRPSPCVHYVIETHAHIYPTTKIIIDKKKIITGKDNLPE